MKKTVLTISLVIAASNMYPSQDTFAGRFGGVTTAAPQPVTTTKKVVRNSSGPESFDARFGGTKQTKKASHSMTGANDPAAEKALKAGGPVGLAKYMVRKIASALGYSLNEMIDLVQSAMGDHSQPVAAPRKTTQRVKQTAAPTSFQARW